MFLLLIWFSLIFSNSISAQTCSLLWQQCGGQGWTGPTCCVAGSYCSKQDNWYSQCLPGSTTLLPTLSPTPVPTRRSRVPTAMPTVTPTLLPTNTPTKSPTPSPTIPSPTITLKPVPPTLSPTPGTITCGCQCCIYPFFGPPQCC